MGSIFSFGLRLARSQGFAPLVLSFCACQVCLLSLGLAPTCPPWPLLPDSSLLPGHPQSPKAQSKPEAEPPRLESHTHLPGPTPSLQALEAAVLSGLRALGSRPGRLVTLWPAEEGTVQQEAVRTARTLLGLFQEQQALTPQV